MNPVFTHISQEAYDTAIDEMLTIDKAVCFLEKHLQIRTLYSKIMKFSKGRNDKEMKRLLIYGLMRHHPDMNPESLRRRVEKWLDPRSTQSLRSKQDTIEVAFLLGLTLQEADEFVTMVTGESLHYRSAQEIVFIYGLQNGLTFEQTTELAKKTAIYLADIKDKAPALLNEKDQTASIRPLVANLHTEQELMLFLKQEAGRLGYFHNTAYQYFNLFMQKLLKPIDESSAKNVWCDEENVAKERLFVQSILREYFLSDIVPLAKELPKDDDPVIRTIKREIVKNWPESAGLSKMKHRYEETKRKERARAEKEKKEKEKNSRKDGSINHDSERYETKDESNLKESKSKSLKKYDVSRKVLILLYLATYSDVEEDPLDRYPVEETDVNMEGCEDPLDQSGLTDRGWDEEALARDQVFGTIYRGINTLLVDCGFSCLDPRSPFDWIIIYSICAEDLLDMDERKRLLLLRMFPEKNPEKTP